MRFSGFIKVYLRAAALGADCLPGDREGSK